MSTSPHRLEKELYELVEKDEQIFKFIEQSSLDGMWYWDLENPEHEWMSERFWTTLGYDPKEMKHLASEWQDIINQEDLNLAFDNFTKHCENPEHPYDQIVRYTHKQGHTVWIRCRGLAIRDHEGKAVRMLGAHTDLTELKHTEEKLLETLKSRDLFFAKMSHEIRTPLHGIIALTDLLKTSNQDQSLTKTIETISTCGEQLLVLLDDLLTISKLKEQALYSSQEPVRLSEVTAHIADLFTAKAKEKQLSLTIDMPESTGGCVIMTDKVRLIQILSNLVNNAIKFTTSGKVTLDAECVADSVKIIIKDTGRGIEDVDTVLQAFKQEKANPYDDSGTGLGLEIVSRLCTELGHDMHIESTIDKGTTVTITCALAKKAASVDTIKQTKSQSQHSKFSLNSILIVDDNDINLEIACTMLEGVAHKIDRAHNGDEAVKKVIQENGYDCILMDLNMPIKDGFQATKEILQLGELELIPVIVAVSADAFDETLDTCKKVGMKGHLRKPFTRDSLISGLHEIILRPST
ncbi:ATP-binding protein [Glaciecola siphonariae]|uniref:histidine kinase n=1 Tax=Glaciecola siphonariae TaxID=521012 RepID=A0ABV9LXE7_9ALTE